VDGDLHDRVAVVVGDIENPEALDQRQVERAEILVDERRQHGR
jgi:hypothetical protein